METEEKAITKFKQTSVKQVVNDIFNHKIFLPPIQRNFVWDRERIIQLFDSLYRNYPIGNCIFWKMKPQTLQNYTLYGFVKEQYENKSNIVRNEKVSGNFLDKSAVYSVVDGQQRLSSFYIGLCGQCYYKKKGQGLKNIPTNFIPTKLFFNLFSTEKREEDSPFDFREENRFSLNNKNLWIEVGKIMQWNEEDKAKEITYIQRKINATKKKTLIEYFKSKKNNIIEKLNNLYKMLNDDLIYFFDIDNQNIDEVVDIFTRVNSGGMILKKSDLLFSMLVSHWSDGRTEIKDLIDSMEGLSVSVSQDFIIRSCLVLSDLPVQYKLASFSDKNIKKIKDNWGEIKKSLMKLCEILSSIGYRNLPGLSANALIPIAYYIMKGGKIDAGTKKELQKYYVVSQINTIYGGTSDSVLEKVRQEIKTQLNRTSKFCFQGFKNLNLRGSKSFNIDDFEKLVEEASFGSSRAELLLLLIYSRSDFKVRGYQVDHINPKSKFNHANYINNNIALDDEKEKEWEEKRNNLPNLQLLDPKDNNNKRSKSLTEYLNGKTPKERRAFIDENLLPKDKKMWDLKNFDEFYDWRKKQLIKVLKRKLGL